MTLALILYKDGTYLLTGTDLIWNKIRTVRDKLEKECIITIDDEHVRFDEDSQKILNDELYQS